MPWAAAQAKGSPAGRTAQDLPAGADCLGRRPRCPRGLPLSFLHGGVLRLQSFVPRMDAELKAPGHSKLLGQGPPADQRPPTGWRSRAQVQPQTPSSRSRPWLVLDPSLLPHRSLNRSPVSTAVGWCWGVGAWSPGGSPSPVPPPGPEPSSGHRSAGQVPPPPRSRLRHGCRGGFSPQCPGGDQGGQGTGARARPGGAAQLEKGSLRPPPSESGVG